MGAGKGPRSFSGVSRELSGGKKVETACLGIFSRGLAVERHRKEAVVERKYGPRGFVEDSCLVAGGNHPPGRG